MILILKGKGEGAKASKNGNAWLNCISLGVKPFHSSRIQLAFEKHSQVFFPVGAVDNCQ